MVISVNTNSPSLFAQNEMSKSNSALGVAIERLSSGLRVNRAKDDAAGMAIANRMEANLRADSQTTRGITDGISLMQTAEGGLDGINALLHRSRILAVQGSTGTLSDADRASLNNEFHELRAEIDRIARTTEAFGKFPLAQSSSAPIPQNLGKTPPLTSKFPVSGSGGRFYSGIVSTAFVPAGAKNVTLSIDSLGADDDIQLFSLSGQHLVGTPIEGGSPDIVWTQKGVTDSASAKTNVLTSDNGFLPTATYSATHLLEGGAAFSLTGSAIGTYNGMTFTYSGDGDRYEDAATGIFNNGVNGAERLERLNIDKATEDLLIMVVGSGEFTATATWDSMPSPSTTQPLSSPVSEGIDIVMSAHYGQEIQKVTIAPTPSDSVTLGIDKVELDPWEKAQEAMGKLQEALQKVDTYRGQYGALHNRFESAIANLAQQQINTATARSRITDADYAVEVSNMTRAQILQQAGTAVLTKANQSTQSVMTLLN